MQTPNASFTPRSDRRAQPDTDEMLWEVTELAGGAAVMLLPMLLLAMPGIILFVALPGLVLLAVAAVPAVVAGAILAPMYLLTRLVRRLQRPRPDRSNVRQPWTRSSARRSEPARMTHHAA